VSGKLSQEALNSQVFANWKSTGWREEEHHSRPGFIKKTPWSHMEDRLKYDVLPQANKLTMPVLLVVGDKDESTPPSSQQKLFDMLPGKKELHLIKDSPHTFVEPQHLKEVQKILEQWIEAILSPLDIS
jgi:pimeloyl-ACP methyl ester carboxylesterase